LKETLPCGELGEVLITFSFPRCTFVIVKYAAGFQCPPRSLTETTPAWLSRWGLSRRAAVPRDAGRRVGLAPGLRARGSCRPAEHDCASPPAGGADAFSTHGPAVAVLGNVWLEEKLHSHPGTPPARLMLSRESGSRAARHVSPRAAPHHAALARQLPAPEHGGVNHILKNKINSPPLNR